jgi:hypothetical protein
MVKELRIVLDDTDYKLLTTHKNAEKLTWKQVLYKAFGLRPPEENEGEVKHG